MQVSTAMGGVSKKVKMLLKFGADLSHRDFDMGTPLHHAVFAQNPEAVSALLSAGNKREFTATTPNPVNMTNMSFYTPLHHILSVAEGEHTAAIIKMLLDSGADINASTPTYADGPVYGAFSFIGSEGIESIFSPGVLSICVRTPTWGVSLTSAVSNFKNIVDLNSCTGITKAEHGLMVVQHSSFWDGPKKFFKPLDLTDGFSVLGSQRILGFSMGFNNTKTVDAGGTRINTHQPRFTSLTDIQDGAEFKLAFTIPASRNTELARGFKSYKTSCNNKTTAAHLFFSKGAIGSELLMGLIEPLYNPMLLDKAGASAFDLLELSLEGVPRTRKTATTVERARTKRKTMIDTIATTQLAPVSTGSMFEDVDTNVFRMILEHANVVVRH